MGDATHINVPALAAAGTQLVAGYVTGTPDIQWTAADWARFPNQLHVTIDQGASGSPVLSAVVRDVEPGAWTATAAVNRNGWTAARPTIYCSASVVPQLYTAGWRGDVWVANWTGAPPSSPYPVPAGMTCVAVQWTDQGGGGLYDLSVVFDPIWPMEGSVLTAWQPGTVQVLYSPAGQLQISGVGQDNCVYLADLHPDFTTSTPQQVSAPLTFTS